MWFQSFILVAGLLLMLSCLSVESKRRHRNRKSDSLLDFDEQFRQGQEFMKHQINSHHRNRGWKHGRKSRRSSESSSSSVEQESVTSTVRQSEYEKRFKEFIKSHGCEDSPVYNKFMQLYKTATANLKQKGGGNKYETPWLQELAANYSTGNYCPNSCPNSGNSMNNNVKEVIQPITGQTDDKSPITTNKQTETTLGLKENDSNVTVLPVTDATSDQVNDSNTELPNNQPSGRGFNAGKSNRTRNTSDKLKTILNELPTKYKNINVPKIKI